MLERGRERVDRDSPLAEASRRFWSIRLQLARETVSARSPVTGEGLEDDFLESLTELLAVGARARRGKTP